MRKKLSVLIFLIALSAFSTALGADGIALIKEGKLGTTFSDAVFHQNICGTDVECQLAHGQDKDRGNKLYITCDVTKHTSKKYIFADLYFVPLSGLESITLQTKGASNVSEKLKDGWRENRLNSLRAIYEQGDEYCTYGYATFYVNGVKMLDRVPCKNAVDFANLRVAFNGVNKAELLQMYISRYKYFSSEQNPYGNIYPVIKNGGKTFLSGIYVENGTKTGDVTFEDSAVKIYEDGTFSSLKSSGDLLRGGNIAVVENENGVYTFDVKFMRDDGLFLNKALDLTDEKIFENIKNASYDIAENDGVPSSLRLENKNNYSNAEYYFKISFAEFFDGIELKMKVYSKNISGLQFMSELGAEISDRAYVLNGKVSLNKWNDVRLVFDKRAHTVEFYVNDVLISDKYFGKLGIDKSYSKIRLMMFGKAGTSGYLKNAQMFWFLNETSNGEGFKISDKTALNFSDLTLYVPEDVKVCELESIFDGAYTVTDGFGNTKGADECVFEGDCALCENGEFKRFTIKRLYKDKLIRLDETDENACVIVYGENESAVYIADYGENGMTNAEIQKTEQGKINCFTVKKGGDTTKVMLWSDNLMPYSEMSEFKRQ